MRFLAIICLMFFFVSMTPLSLFAVTRHGCAPLRPPPVSGTLLAPPAQYGTLLINEVLTLPHSTWNCSEAGVYTPTNDAWVELYNPQSQPFDLYAVHTSLDSGPNTNAFYLPFGSAIGAHSYLVVFPRTSAAFLSTEGTTLRLIIGGVVIDEITIPPLGEDQSYARTPDGSRIWQMSNQPTIDASNAPGQQATPTPGKNNGGGNGHTSNSLRGSYTGTTSGTNHKTLVTGTQPGWYTLQFPPSGTPVVLTTTGGATPSPQPSTTWISRTRSCPPFCSLHWPSLCCGAGGFLQLHEKNRNTKNCLPNSTICERGWKSHSLLLQSYLRMSVISLR